MKRTFAKRGLMSLVAGFFLFGVLMLTASRAEAQTAGTPYTWMGSDEARQELEVAVVDLYNQLALLQPGTPNYNTKLAHAYYYRVIRQQITQGTAVIIAVDSALEIVSGGSDGIKPYDTSVFDDVTIDAALKQQMKNNAVNLLTL